MEVNKLLFRMGDISYCIGREIGDKSVSSVLHHS